MAWRNWASRPRPCADVPAEGGVELACGLRVLGNQGGILVKRFGAALFDCGGRPPMQLSAIGFEL